MLHFPSPDIGRFGRRQRHVRGHRIPVTISRKASASNRDRIVIDTFGADDVALLRGGCPCCTVRPKLRNALLGLLAEGEWKPFSRIAIESAEALGPILRTFASERALGGEYYVQDAPPLDGDRFTLTEDAPLSWDAFSRFVTTLTALRGPDLLRIAGPLNVAGCRGPVAVQLMGHLAARPVELQAWRTEDRVTRLEFVTRGIEEKMVRDLFESVRALAAPPNTQTSS
ncbi:MAG: GTP-binding protein [Xanthobacteraceae bacterium]